MDGWLGYVDGRVGEWINGWLGYVDGWVSGWMDGQIGGWMDK